MKNLNKWLLSAVLAMVLSNGFGQAQSLEVCNNTVEVMKVVLAAVDAPNTGPVQRTSAQLINPGDCAVFTPLFQSQTSEWVYVMAGVNGWSSPPPNNYNEDVNSNPFASSTPAWINSVMPASGGGATFIISWFAAFQIDLN